MARKKKEQFIDLGRAESEKFEPTEEVRNEFDEAAQLGSTGQESKHCLRQRRHPRD